MSPMSGDNGPPPREDGDPGPGDDSFIGGAEVISFHDRVEMQPKSLVTDETLARWLGLQAAKFGVVSKARALIHPSVMSKFEAGCDLPAITRIPHGLSDGSRSAWLRTIRALGVRSDAPPSTDMSAQVTIARMVQRHDIGNDTRYDVTLRQGDADYVLRGLSGEDLRTWERLAVRAMHARLMLYPLRRGEIEVWLREVARAIGEMEVRTMTPEESTAMEMHHRLMEMALAARRWEYAADDTRPIGLAYILRGGLIGWPREPLKNELRARMGTLDRRALTAAIEGLSWVAREWRYESRAVYVWCCAEEQWAKVVQSTKR